MLNKKGDLHVVRAESPGPVNAIPSKAFAEIVTDCRWEIIRDEISRIEAIFRREYRVTEPGLYVRATARRGLSVYSAMDDETTRRAVCLLACAPNGIQEMSAEIPNLPQTSLNFGQVQVKEGVLEGSFCNRSNVSSQLEMLNDRLAAIAENLGGSVILSTGHAAWEYAPESALRQRIERVYQHMTGEKPHIAVTHGGTECGVLLEKISGMDCVAIGPDMTDVHTPKETLDVGSTMRTWNFLLEILKDLRE